MIDPLFDCQGRADENDLQIRILILTHLNSIVPLYPGPSKSSSDYLQIRE